MDFRTTLNHWYLNLSVNITTLVFTIVCGIVLLLGRYFLFPIRPVPKEDEPQQLSYWIPYIGHGLWMYSDPFQFLSYAYKTLGQDEPFAISLFSQKFYVVPSLNLISSVYRNHATLTNHPLVEDIYKGLDMSDKGLETLFHSSLQPTHISQGSLNKQFLPGEHLDELSARLLKYEEECLRWEKISNVNMGSSSEGTKVILLHKWCADVLGTAAARALFGNVLLEMSPDLLNHMHFFDEIAWQVIFKFPRMSLRNPKTTKVYCQEAFIRFFNLPSDQRGDMCHWVRTHEAMQRGAGMEDRDIGIAALVFYWAFYTNSFKVCFWLLSHIVHTEGAVDEVRKEILGCIENSKINYRRIIEDCPLLISAWHEVLRLTSTDSVRKIEKPVVIGTKTIPADGRIYIPHRKIHRNETVFGNDVTSFDIKRFLGNNLSRDPHYKPFGGGAALCPGRFVAKIEILSFVALVLHRYNLKFKDPNQRVPRRNERKPTLGVASPLDGGKILVDISPRI